MPHLRPEQFGRAAGGWHKPFFEFRISTTDSLEHLRAVNAYEHDRRGETRQERIATVNEQIQRVKAKR